MKNILIIDNYDSFTYNLVHYFAVSGIQVNVLYPHSAKINEVAARSDAIVISPGPSHPANATSTIRLIKSYFHTKPMFGVCLGMQILNEVLGGTTKKAHFPVHGKTAKIELDLHSPLFKGIPSQIKVARYHSLTCDSIAPSLDVIAHYNKIVMALQHTKYPVFGVQFHPESFLSECGQVIIDNFIRMI